MVEHRQVHSRGRVQRVRVRTWAWGADGLCQHCLCDTAMMFLRLGTRVGLSSATKVSRPVILATRTLTTSTCKQQNEGRNRKLFTPGPLCVSMTTKQAMLRDLGSRETEFIQLIQDIRTKLVELAGVSTDRYTCVPMQGSGTFAIEAVLTTTVPRKSGKVLVLENGAYGRRQVGMCKTLGIPHHHEFCGEAADVDAQRVAEILSNDPSFTHVSVVHCETSTGIFNNVEKIGEAVKKHAPNAVFFVDAMSSFGAVPLNMSDANIDYLVSSANKCIQGVPGFSFALCHTEHLLTCEGNSRSLSLDLVDQYKGLEAGGQFRFTPPTHAMLAFRQALSELEDEGSVEGRSRRYQANRQCLRDGMTKMGFREFLPEAIAGYIITTYLFPDTPAFDFKKFYSSLYEKGQVIYPGKLSQMDCFRLGNIGDLHMEDMEKLLIAIEETCQEMGIDLPLS